MIGIGSLEIPCATICGTLEGVGGLWKVYHRRFACPNVLNFGRLMKSSRKET